MSVRSPLLVSCSQFAGACLVSRVSLLFLIWAQSRGSLYLSLTDLLLIILFNPWFFVLKPSGTGNFYRLYLAIIHSSIKNHAVTSLSEYNVNFMDLAATNSLPRNLRGAHSLIPRVKYTSFDTVHHIT